MPTEPSVDVTANGKCLIVRISGDMDHQTAPFFRTRLKEEITRGQRGAVLDMSAVSYFDSAGLNLLLNAWRQAREAGSVLALARVPAPVHRILTITAADKVLHVYDTVAEAKDKIAAGET
ncbi:STAS domain-containing protein [Streptomyces sp. NPDC058733]|uniref:STAS domain-containing protein n=1 Tax=unclassified Streptomyces TaxID=2593676 RepID=UPI0034554AEE